MDLLAVESDRAEHSGGVVMHNSRQNEASEYGSSFSRGMILATDDRPTCWVSGTASIDGQGRTVHHGDAQSQVLETLLDVAALLETHGTKLRDICHATAYCKREEDYRAFARIIKHLHLDEVPFVPMIADVCRDELLFELDAVAVKNLDSSH
jgi:enamine deaminase RidA (YjgF/YER057c/UK114 family)